MTTIATPRTLRRALLLFFLVCFSCAPALAQKKLVPLDCPWEEWGCTDSMFVEEGTIVPNNGCISAHRDDVRVYTLGPINLSFYHDSILVHEFRQLDRTVPIDSSKAHVLTDETWEIVQFLRDSVGACDVFPLHESFAHGKCVIRVVFRDYYDLPRLVTMLNKRTESTSVLASLYPECFILTTSVASHRSEPTSLISTDGGIRLENMRGAFTIIDVSGRILHQGVLADGETPRFVTLQPGVYMVVTPTERQQVLVMP